MKLDVRWDKLTPDEITEIEQLAADHGPSRLVRAAQRAWQPEDPPAFADAWLGTWRALPSPDDPRAVTRETCPTHSLEQPCRGCAADRKAAEP